MVEDPIPLECINRTNLNVTWNIETSSAKSLVHILTELRAVLVTFKIYHAILVNSINSIFNNKLFKFGLRWTSCWIRSIGEDFEPLVRNVWIGTSSSNVILCRPCKANSLTRGILRHWVLSRVAIFRTRSNWILASSSFTGLVVKTSIFSKNAANVSIPTTWPCFAFGRIVIISVSLRIDLVISARNPRVRVDVKTKAKQQKRANTIQFIHLARLICSK